MDSAALSAPAVQPVNGATADVDVRLDLQASGQPTDRDFFFAFQRRLQETPLNFHQLTLHLWLCRASAFPEEDAPDEQELLATPGVDHDETDPKAQDASPPTNPGPRNNSQSAATSPDDEINALAAYKNAHTMHFVNKVVSYY